MDIYVVEIVDIYIIKIVDKYIVELVAMFVVEVGIRLVFICMPIYILNLVIEKVSKIEQSSSSHFVCHFSIFLTMLPKANFILVPTKSVSESGLKCLKWVFRWMLNILNWERQ